MNKNLILTFLAFVGLQNAYSQYFLPAVDDGIITMAPEVYVVTNEGDTLYGKVPSAFLSGNQIRSFTLKQENGDKVKLKAEDVELVAFKSTRFFNKLSALSVPNIQRAAELDMRKLMDRQWIYFEKVELPNKDGKFGLMQLLNSGFDSKIKVYEDPNANSTMTTEVNGLTLAGGDDRSYIIVKDGQKGFLVRKPMYRKDDPVNLIFDGCPAITDEFGSELNWLDFSQHVFIHSQFCD